jgi:REP element-mobilizing transposase RayT
MGKLLRFLLEGHCYHVTTRTRGAAPVLRDPANARIIVDALQFVRRDRAYLLGYAILPDHLHAVLVPRGQQTISRVMQSIKGYSARLMNARRGRSGPLSQPSFYDRVIRDEAHLLDTLEYMHRNPVAAGLADTPEEYLFSSAHPDAQTDLEMFLSGSAEAGKPRLRASEHGARDIERRGKRAKVTPDPQPASPDAVAFDDTLPHQ